MKYYGTIFVGGGFILVDFVDYLYVHSNALQGTKPYASYTAK